MQVLTEPAYDETTEIELRRVSMRLLDGYDLNARPVMVAALGNVDIPALKKKGVTVAMMVRRHARAMEELLLRLQAAPNPQAGHLLIMDLAGCTVLKFWRALPYIREVAHMGAVYYPEVLAKLCFVRGPDRSVWAIEKVSKLLNPATREKVSLSTKGDVLPLIRAHLPPTTALPPDLDIATWPPMHGADDAGVARAAGSQAPRPAWRNAVRHGGRHVRTNGTAPGTKSTRPPSADGMADLTDMAMLPPASVCAAAGPMAVESASSPSARFYSAMAARIIEAASAVPAAPATSTPALPSRPSRPSSLLLHPADTTAPQPLPAVGAAAPAGEERSGDGESESRPASSVAPLLLSMSQDVPYNSLSSEGAQPVSPTSPPSPTRPPGQLPLPPPPDEWLTRPLMLRVASGTSSGTQVHPACASRRLFDSTIRPHPSKTARCSLPFRQACSFPQPLAALTCPSSAVLIGHVGCMHCLPLLFLLPFPLSAALPPPPLFAPTCHAPMLRLRYCWQVSFNDATSVFPLETEHFSGKCYFRLRGLRGEPTGYFAGKKRWLSMVVQGRVKRPLQMTNCSNGFEFDHSLVHLPGRKMIKMCLSVVRVVAPGVTIDLLGERPTILNPLFDAVQRLNVSLPGSEPDIVGCGGTLEVVEDTTLLGGVFAQKVRSRHTS